MRSNFDEVAAKLHKAAGDAVGTLHAGLFSESAATRIRAAVAILNLAITFAEINDLANRILMLEQRTRKNA
jgi:hypothetical protein